MAVRNDIGSGGIVTFVVKVGGSTIPDENRVYSIKVEHAVNKISTAQIEILDGDFSTGTFQASSSDTFLPGREISIEAGYDNNNKIIFKGIITEQTIRIDHIIGSALIVTCSDEAIKTTVGRKSKTFIKTSDSDILTSILGTYSGITTNITATTFIWPQQVQYDTTDWDFILARAAANGLIVKTINGKVSVEKPDSDTTSVLEIESGNNLYEFHANLNAVSQLDKVKSSSWDYANQELIDAEMKNSFSGPGNLSSTKLSEVVGLKTFDLQSPAPIKNDELENWNQAQLIKNNLSKIQGKVVCPGNPSVQIGKYITLSAVGDRFNGDHLVSKVTHNISDGNWMTEYGIGLSDEWIAKQNKTKAISPSGLLSGVNGLFTATVKKIDQDPENQYRILVDVPLFNTSGEGLWARLSSFYASNNAGAFFMPEIGDEVVVGFLNEDPRFPIILGSLYSNPKLKPSEGLNPNPHNSTKAIVSKSGIEIIFDDENQTFTITTPDKNKVVFSDADKQIIIQDQNDNTITMSQTGIELKSPKSISIDSSEKVSIIGAQGISLVAQGGDVNVKGLNIQHKADVEFSAEGSASASVQGGGQLTLQGAMVMIN
ncbi:type VI secretion system tip protein VgrG [Oceanihabitans sp. 2_MG-2023]|uniref:type VI secretion system tip protein VgrG n=1 Tax=Oceanihabitans sp. 2_MG-2023 TaxID=3062661 RepID=UPI0026E45FD6|nr:type VI secretion system tip protein VgrG [Oceanihabitans sp. 2_MG-2023]MDO6595317.1 type VI secretion system tip protein VgrG [Oceanihabitans sp. 2_MG-2023]